MSNRITRKDLDNQITVLNSICSARDLPDRYELMIWSPGDRDGTRYKLMLIGGHREVSPTCNARQIYNTLYTLVTVLERF